MPPICMWYREKRQCQHVTWREHGVHWKEWCIEHAPQIGRASKNLSTCFALGSSLIRRRILAREHVRSSACMMSCEMYRERSAERSTATGNRMLGTVLISLVCPGGVTEGPALRRKTEEKRRLGLAKPCLGRLTETGLCAVIPFSVTTVAGPSRSKCRRASSDTHSLTLYTPLANKMRCSGSISGASYGRRRSAWSCKR